jgi:hypothetical protein
VHTRELLLPFHTQYKVISLHRRRARCVNVMSCASIRKRAQKARKRREGGRKGGVRMFMWDGYERVDDDDNLSIILFFHVSFICKFRIKVSKYVRVYGILI